MSIAVPAQAPTAKPPPYEGLKARGTYTGMVLRIEPPVEEADPYVIDWTFQDSDGKTWNVDQDCDEEELGAVLAALGFAGQSIEPGEAVGSKAALRVGTFGGRTSARVLSVSALS